MSATDDAVPSPKSGHRAPAQGWLWLFPTTFLVHAAEEYWIAGGYYEWASATPDADLTATEFGALISLAFLGILALVLVVRAWPGLSWLALTIGTAFFLNGVSHTVTTVTSASFSPGTVTGVLIWWPLGIYTLRRLKPILTRPQLMLGIGVGVAMQFGVTAVGMLFTFLI